MTVADSNSKENFSEQGPMNSSNESCGAPLEESVPEGRWGWFIVVAIASCKVATAGILPFIAIIFKSVITRDPEYEGSAVTFLVGLFFLVCEATGFFFPNLNRKFSLRATSFSGGIILTVGCVASIFVISVPQLAFTYSVLQGAGYGLMLSSELTAFNQFFRRRATTAMATAMFATSVLCLGLPHGVQFAMGAGGERASRALVAALGIVTAATQLFVRGGPHPTRATDVQQPLKEQDEINDQDILPQNAAYTLMDTSKRIVRPWVQRYELAVWHHLGFSKRPLRAAAVWGSAVGLALVHVGDSNFFALLPLHLSNVGFDKEEVTKSIATANIGDSVGRFALIVLGIWLGGRNRHIFAGASIGTAFCVLGISWVVSWEAVLTFSALLGMFRGILYVALFLVFAEIVQPNLFPSALALFFFFVFVSSLVMAPLIGLVRDATRSYPASFCLVAALCALFPVAWTAHALWRRCSRERRKLNSVTPCDKGRLQECQQDADGNVSQRGTYLWSAI